MELHLTDAERAAWLAGNRPVQVFLPTYSPNLNLIERFWTFLRQKVKAATTGGSPVPTH